MKSPVRYMPILAAALALAGMAGTANAATELNMGGSSAGRNFATDVPLNLCDAGTSVLDYPTKYAHADGNKTTWVCKRGGLDVIMRYSSTGSSDGVNKLLQPTTADASKMLFLDHTNLAGCTGPADTTRPSDNKHYNLFTGCTNTTAAPGLGIHMGASDVQGASFHQVGPLGTTVSPLDDSTLNSVVTAIVPFSVLAGKGVVKLSANGTAPNGQIDGLSRLQVERIFSGSITDWRQLGFGTVTDADPTVLEATSPIKLCMRSAGSGTKAAFDETLMINATETPLASATHVFGNTSTLVETCLTDANGRRAVGYMDADEYAKLKTGGTLAGLAYPVRIDGALAYDPSLTDPKRDLKCGRYAYWAGWRLNRRTTSEGAAIDALAQAYADNAGAATTIAQIPTGAFWASDEEMFVSKNVDKGPLIFKAGAHLECR